MDEKENEVLQTRREIDRLGRLLEQRTATITHDNIAHESSGFMLTELVTSYHRTRLERNSDASTSRMITETREAKVWR